MSQITCPACHGYLGLGAARCLTCPKCGAGLTSCAESNAAAQNNRLPGGVLTSVGKFLLQLLGGTAIAVLTIGTAVLLVPSFIDVAIPGGFGLWLSLWPRLFFYLEPEPPDEAKVARFRSLGIGLLFVAGLALVVRLCAR
jgi:hypothetical protein